jgi:quercetin dioxygenase-like cupin family protein
LFLEILKEGIHMQIVRVFAGDDGESHFEDVTPEEMVTIAKRLGSGDIELLSRQAPSFSDYHIAPRRQYVMHLLGTAEYETADGTKRQFLPGDILVAEDLSGHGHIARGLGEGQRYLLAVPLADA